MFCEKGVLRNFTKFTGKHVCHCLFFNKVVGWSLQFIKKWLWHRCFPVNIAKFLTPFRISGGYFERNARESCGDVWHIRPMLPSTSAIWSSCSKKHVSKMVFWYFWATPSDRRSAGISWWLNLFNLFLYFLEV